MSEETQDSEAAREGEDARLRDLLDRVEQGESVTIMRQGRPVARLVPVPVVDEGLSRAAAARIRERRKRMRGAPIEQLIETMHEGHRS